MTSLDFIARVLLDREAYKIYLSDCEYYGWTPVIWEDMEWRDKEDYHRRAYKMISSIEFSFEREAVNVRQT